MFYKKAIQERFFRAIESGEKEYEVRINREDWSQIKVGDMIQFFINNSTIILLTKVVELKYFKTFGEAYDKVGSKMIPFKNVDRNYVCNLYDELYSTENDKKDIENYGIVAVRVMVQYD